MTTLLIISIAVFHFVILREILASIWRLESKADELRVALSKAQALTEESADKN